jgi:lipase ATG15
VSYRLITSMADPSFGVVAVRGSTTAWEFLTDAQLWLGSALLVLLRGFLPFGSAWTPILHQVLIALTFVESTSLERVALYKQTTSLVTSLLNTGNFSTLHITGHSLGKRINTPLHDSGKVAGSQTLIAKPLQFSFPQLIFHAFILFGP